MLLSKKQLFSLRVVTRGGVYLGFVVDFSFDISTYTITQYHVSSQNIFSKKRIYFIHKDQILYITQQQIIVDDLVVALIKEKKKGIKLHPFPRQALYSKR